MSTGHSLGSYQGASGPLSCFWFLKHQQARGEVEKLSRDDKVSPALVQGGKLVDISPKPEKCTIKMYRGCSWTEREKNEVFTEDFPKPKLVSSEALVYTFIVPPMYKNM